MHDDESLPEHTLFHRLASAKYAKELAQREAEVRAELIAKVHKTILTLPYRVGFYKKVAEAAVDALADYYRAQLETSQ